MLDHSGKISASTARRKVTGKYSTIIYVLPNNEKEVPYY
jgi:hypothetical protein